MNRETFREIVNFLIELNFEPELWQMIVKRALYGSTVLGQIKLTSNNQVIVLQLVERLIHFDGADSGYPSLVALLNEVKQQTGCDNQQRIDHLIQKIRAPESETDRIASVSQKVEPATSQDDPIETESNRKHPSGWQWIRTLLGDHVWERIGAIAGIIIISVIIAFAALTEPVTPPMPAANVTPSVVTSPTIQPSHSPTITQTVPAFSLEDCRIPALESLTEIQNKSSVVISANFPFIASDDICTVSSRFLNFSVKTDTLPSTHPYIWILLQDRAERFYATFGSDLRDHDDVNVSPRIDDEALVNIYIVLADGDGNDALKKQGSGAFDNLPKLDGSFLTLAGYRIQHQVEGQ